MSYDYVMPEKAVTDINRITEGAVFYHGSLLSNYFVKWTVITGPTKYQDWEASEGLGDWLHDTLWIRVASEDGNEWQSLHDTNIGGHYNDWYLFESEEDYNEAFANRKPAGQPIGDVVAITDEDDLDRAYQRLQAFDFAVGPTTSIVQYVSFTPELTDKMLKALDWNERWYDPIVDWAYDLLDRWHRFTNTAGQYDSVVINGETVKLPLSAVNQGVIK